MSSLRTIVVQQRLLYTNNLSSEYKQMLRSEYFFKKRRIVDLPLRIHNFPWYHAKEDYGTWRNIEKLAKKYALILSHK